MNNKQNPVPANLNFCLMMGNRQFFIKIVIRTEYLQLFYL